MFVEVSVLAARVVTVLATGRPDPAAPRRGRDLAVAALHQLVVERLWPTPEGAGALARFENDPGAGGEVARLLADEAGRDRAFAAELDRRWRAARSRTRVYTLVAVAVVVVVLCCVGGVLTALDPAGVAGFTSDLLR
ncbi:hypothetical protein R8Z50_18245 [Longispora sp. K20-0274]|uniref:hypothetical protein n=1 Tax=Longispora sp. K20-0274 TaxID=3088255 RepID=UPI0039998EFF